MRMLLAAGAGTALASAAYQAYGERRDARRFPPPGQLVDIGGGQRLHLWCAGEGSPTVVVLPALGTPALEWVGIQRTLREHTRVCLVDRAGIGWSDPGPGPRTFSRIVDDLAAALRAADIASPYVLVGHSTGGLAARLYAARHRDQVAALVLVDSSHEEQNRRFYGPGPWHNPLVGWVLRSWIKPMGFIRAGVDVGLTHHYRRDAQRLCPPDLVDTHIALSLTSRSRRAATQEVFGYLRSITEMHRHARDLDALPTTLITAGPGGTGDKREAEYAIWRELQDDLATLSSDTTRIYADQAGHNVHLDDPGLTAHTLRTVVDRIRHHSST